MKKKKNLTGVLVVAAFLIVSIIVVIVVGLNLPQQPEIVQGWVETTDYRVSGKLPARIHKLMVEEGDYVKKGDTLVVLVSPEIEAKLSQAEAAYSAAKAVETKAKNGSRLEQQQAAYEMWQKAIAGLTVAEKTYERVNRLYEEGVVAAQKRDEALAQYEAMKATEKAAKSQYDMAMNGAREEDKAAAEAQVRRAEGAMSEVNAYRAETVLLATEDGMVTEIFPEEGELVGSGAPILNVERVDKAWFTFNIREDMLAKFDVGTETEVFVPARNRDVKVRITKMKDVGSFAVWKATKALDGYDLKTFEVQAKAINPDDMADIHSGMSAVIKVSLDEK